MPGIIDHLFALEAARVIGDHLLAQQHDDAICTSTSIHRDEFPPAIP